LPNEKLDAIKRYAENVREKCNYKSPIADPAEGINHSSQMCYVPTAEILGYLIFAYGEWNNG
jgi:hypothetical protein